MLGVIFLATVISAVRGEDSCSAYWAAPPRIKLLKLNLKKNSFLHVNNQQIFNVHILFVNTFSLTFNVCFWWRIIGSLTKLLCIKLPTVCRSCHNSSIVVQCAQKYLGPRFQSSVWEHQISKWAPKNLGVSTTVKCFVAPALLPSFTQVCTEQLLSLSTHHPSSSL